MTADLRDVLFEHFVIISEPDVSAGACSDSNAAWRTG